MRRTGKSRVTKAAEIRAAEIGAHQIGKTFGRFTALEDISLTIGRGEFLTLLGPSGSGKTTFLMILSGFEAATSGRLTLNGQDVTQMPAEDRAFGMVFQGYALFPHMTVEENIAFPLKVQRRGAADIKRRVADMVEMVGLGGHGHKRPSGLSGGQQQRVALARALVYAPPVLLLDEPFSALDKNLRGQMQDEMRRLHRETGTTFVFVTHDQSEALALSTRIAIFEKGRLQQVAAPREVYERPANRFVAEFLGDINILPLVDGRFEGQAVRADAGQGAHLAIRPEYMQLHLASPASGNAIAASLQDLTYLGAETRLSLRSPGGVDLALSLPTAQLPAGLAPGVAVWASWPDDRGFFL
ncbi:ABC transporter ATP-binding protein [Gemmobacter fulvus]|uniref:ABC transporter ATP-binding protein n=1 Tax=Gemmobacter fulvus TaxID=2840474 RepID=A0A975P513_9RHOB|nr:ABC transporter ATP-binding protein [Gemmobacter fulvus]MBT9247144.1 ABC transporter ATP-binding protein [Gemmobacter fulvus]QWK88981.1 ABC transporter ATP-binding protein [Gemmobacter fulvus]